jgi:hypothetical protein
MVSTNHLDTAAAASTSVVHLIFYIYGIAGFRVHALWQSVQCVFSCIDFAIFSTFNSFQHIWQIQEIQMLGRPTQPSSPRGRSTSATRRLLNPARLAAALGVASLLSSFQPQQMARHNADNSGGTSRVLKIARSMDATWHSISNTQPARSILQVWSWGTSCLFDVQFISVQFS